MTAGRRGETERRAVWLARAFEVHRRAVLVEVAEGRRPETRRFLEDRGRVVPVVASADLLATAPQRAGGDRLIEVKGRGSSGPITVIERELATLRAAGELGWLYVVFNTTQPQPAELWLVNDPGRLDWTEVTPAARTVGQPRGVRHEAKLQIPAEAVRAAGTTTSLADLGDLPSWCGPSRD